MSSTPPFVTPVPEPAADPASRSVTDRALRFVVPGWGEELGPALWVLFAARIVNVFAFSSAFPFLARYLATDRGLSATAVGSIYMVQGTAGAFVQLAGGLLADRVGRRAVIVWSLVLRAALTAGLGACVQWSSPVAAIVVLSFLNAVLAGVSMPASDALVVDHSREDQRIAAFAHQRVAVNVGWALGPLVGGLVAGRLAFAVMFYVAAPLVLLGAWVLTRLPDARAVAHKRESPFAAVRSTLRDPALRLQMLAALLVFILAGQLIVTLSVDASTRLHFDEHAIGLLWTINGLLVVFLQMPVARAVRRLGASKALVVGALVYAASYAALGFAATWPAVAACVVALTLGELLNAPSQQASLSERTPPDQMARALGLLGLTIMLGRALGPLVGGLAHDAYGSEPRLQWGVLGALGLVAALVYLHPALRRPRPIS